MMRSEVKSQQIESRAQIIEREIRVHQQQCGDLALKSGQLKQDMHARKCDFENLLRSMRTQPSAQLVPRAQAFKARIFDQKARQIGGEQRLQRMQLEQINHKRSEIAALIHSRQAAVEKLNDKAQKIKSSDLIQRETVELDELTSLKACSQSDGADRSTAIIPNLSAGAHQVPRAFLDSRHEHAAHNQIINTESQQTQAHEVGRAWTMQRDQGVSLNYRSAHGHNFQLEFDTGANGVTVRLKPEDAHARTEVATRQASIRRQLELNGVRVDQIICEK